MNKKLFLMTSLVAVALATSSMYSPVQASNDDFDDDNVNDDSSHDDDDKAHDDDSNDDDNSDDDNDSDDDKGGKRKEVRKSELKQVKHSMHRALFAQLDTATQQAIKAVHESYRTQYTAIKNDTTKTLEEKKAALKALHDEVRAKVRALIPTDLQDEFDALKMEIDDLHDMWEVKKDELKTAWKNTKEDWKAKRQERREKMKGKVRVVFGKLDNVLTKFEAKKTPDELVTTYTSIVDKLDEKIADMDQTTELYSFLKSLSEDLNDRIGELQAQ